jgi:polysaccharide export outer membrane protein
MKLKNLFIIGVCAFAMASCSAPNKVIYLREAENIPAEILSQKQVIVDPVLGPGDLLNISVFASDMAAVAPFNKGQYLAADGTVARASTTNSTTTNGAGAEASTDYYLVNTDGYIEMPMLGELKVAGKTKEEFAEEIKNLIYPKYVTVQPTVEVRLMNFKVTVMGSVGHSGQITSKNERMNILEAIAQAGDLSMQGDRETILLYRTNSDGSREVHRLNLHDRNLLLSPYFNLQQNDVIYVEPNRSARQNAWQMHQGWTTTISIVSGLSSIAGLVIGIINLAD